MLIITLRGKYLRDACTDGFGWYVTLPDVLLRVMLPVRSSAGKYVIESPSASFPSRKNSTGLFPVTLRRPVALRLGTVFSA